MANNTGGTTNVTTIRTTTKSAGATVTINGGNGADTINASSEYLKVAAKSSDNFVIIAGNGNDTVYGSNYAELIWGDSNNANDTSANGSDTLNGGGGNDEIHGGNGIDIISGDAGADLLFGERGGDIFKINVVSDSAATSNGAWSSSTGDWVKDFRTIEGDQLDLGGLNSAQPLLQLSAGVSSYGVWIGADTSGNKIVYADMNGDSIADVAVKVTGDIDLGGIINVDDEATGTLTVSGTAAEGGALTASLTGAADADAAVVNTAYQWQEWNGSAWVNLVGQSSATLNIPSDQSLVGKQVRVVATTTDARGGTTAFPSAGQTIANVDDAATGTLAVTGTAAEGGSLTASLTNVSDADGTTSTGYQWQELIGSTWTDIASETNATLSIPSDQSYVGKQVRVVATTTDALGGTTAFPSAGQTIIAAPVVGDVNDFDALAATFKQGSAIDYTDAQGQSTIYGSDFADIVHAGNGNDTVYGFAGADQIFGEGSNDTSLYGQAGDDTISGGVGADTIYGGSGNDILYGYQAPANATDNNDLGDKIYGGSGDDTIYGQTSDDELIGGLGQDTITGASGDDRFRFWTVADGGDHITDFSQVNQNNDTFEFRLPWTSGSYSGGFQMANQAGAGTAAMVDISVTGAGTSSGNMASADVVRLNTVDKSLIDTAAEVDAVLLNAGGTFDGGVIAIGYDTSGKVAIYYDADANSAGGVTMLATIDNLGSTSSLGANDFLFVI